MAEKNTQPSKTLSKMKIGSVFLIDPTMQPKMAKPQDEDFTDAKIHFFFPQN